MRRSGHCFLVLLFLVLLPPAIQPQQLPQQDAAGANLGAMAARSLAGAGPLKDVTVSASVRRVAGSDNEVGTATLMAYGAGFSRVDLKVASGLYSEVRRLKDGIPEGFWSGPDGTAQPIALHNCWTDPFWFFPAFSLLTAVTSPDVVVSYRGRETKDGVALEHIQVSRLFVSKSKSTTQLVQKLSRVDCYLDSASFLPVAMAFSVHPDDDANTDILVEIRFSNYRAVNGIQVPFRVQKFLNGGLVLDLVVQTAIFNSGLSDAVFTIQ